MKNDKDNPLFGAPLKYCKIRQATI